MIGAGDGAVDFQADVKIRARAGAGAGARLDGIGTEIETGAGNGARARVVMNEYMSVYNRNRNHTYTSDSSSRQSAAGLYRRGLIESTDTCRWRGVRRIRQLVDHTQFSTNATETHGQEND